MSFTIGRRQALLMTFSGLVAACGPRVPNSGGDPVADPSPEVLAMYAAVDDGGILVPAVQPRYLIEENIRREVELTITEPAGTIIVDPWQRYLYLIQGNNRALRFRVAVGDQGRAFAGEAVAQYERKWPSWRPTDNMIREFPEQYGPYAGGMEGGLRNPLGARAIYLFKGGRDTYYRIHGTNEMASIGHATSAGCIRMYNQDAIYLASIYRKGAKVLVLTPEQSAGAFGAFVPKTTPFSGDLVTSSTAPENGMAPQEGAPAFLDDSLADDSGARPGYFDPGYTYSGL